jgi:cytochrome c-type biogenesis protein CcmE
MTRKGRRLALIGGALGVAGVAVGLILFALKDSIVFFYGPTELAQKGVPVGTRLRIGGLVKPGSLERPAGGPMTFVVTDGAEGVTVSYAGQVPDLFREGQGVVAEGVLEAPQRFRADDVLAKHDETYMPREVADALKKRGVWKEGEKAGGLTASRAGTSPQ